MMRKGNQRPTIGQGFQLEEPSIFLPWGSQLKEVRKQHAEHAVEEVGGGLRVECVALNGLHCRMWILPEPGVYGPPGTTMNRLMFWRPGPFEESFPDVQAHLEATFGPPLETIPGAEGWPGEYKWVLHDVIIAHHTDDKGAPQEVTIIRKM